MNALAVELLGVAKEYLGPAAPAFLSRELTALGVNANTVEGKHILPLAERARLSAGRVMDGRRAGEFAQALAAHGGRNGTPKVGGDHRLASDAAAKLFAGGRLRQAEQAYRELLAIADRVAAAQGGAMPTPPPLPRVAAPPSATAPAPVPAPTFATRQRPTMIGEAEVAARVAAPPTLPAPQRPTIIGAAEVRAKMAPIAPSPVT